MGSSVSSGYVLGCRKEYIVFGLIAPLMQLLSYIRGAFYYAVLLVQLTNQEVPFL